MGVTIHGLEAILPSALTANDEFPIWDVGAGSGEEPTKKVTLGELESYIAGISASTSTSIMQIFASMDIGTIKHVVFESAASVSDYPSALTSISATTYAFVTIYKYSAGLAAVEITAVIGSSGAIRTIHGEIFNSSIWWGNVI